MKKKSTYKGFTLLEVLLVVAIIVILAAIVIVAINPIEQLGKSRNSKRRADINTISTAVYEYFIEEGNLPASITTTPTEICETGAADCTGYIDLSVLTANEKYLVSIPTDPTNAVPPGVGYEISRSANNRITVTAISPDLGETIEITR